MVKRRLDVGSRGNYGGSARWLNGVASQRIRMKEKSKRPTIFDLVKITGYSTATISRAFNAQPRIDPKTREFIMAKAQEIGYFPHSGARSMTQGKTGRWGLLLPHLHNPRYAEIMDHLDLEARKRSSIFLLGLTRYNPEIETQLVSHWAAGEVDGIIAGTWVVKEVYEQLHHRKYPIVFLFGRPTPQFNLVTFNATKCFDKLLKTALKLGHRRFAYISHTFPECRLHNTFESFQRILGEENLYQEKNVYFGETDESAAFEAWEKMKQCGADAPTFVMCFNDLIATNLISLCWRDGLSLPRDLSVIGSDDIPRADAFDLTTVRTEPAETAANAFRVLESPPTRKGEVVLVQTTIVDRGSIVEPRTGGELPIQRK